ncbi:hypothetical protein NP233_g2093 [Leucocoprinus birnbaumii]|uniref:Nucleolus and neural progenitor protein-like N-terminal domain-containing protein n=1 Tax=Leucocoprinus birnbaumii TaxID=56174 RepID=A0AAD5W1E6_9AGAR|nr:hypothetical protein NP233_g2093 [Leucocoprinus birnbaumii]
MGSKTRSTLLSKSALGTSLHGHVDLALKRLKALSRRLAAISATLSEEVKILNRLYYKGKNQHRISLFWRHVEEIRRLSLRIHSLDLAGTVNRLRHTFYNSTDYTNSNILKASWTHVPPPKELKTILRNSGSARRLLLEADKRFTRAYCSFKQAMQTGAFLQLILTLSAIVCRLQALNRTLLEIMEEIPSAVSELCASLEHSSSASVPAPPILPSNTPNLPSPAEIDLSQELEEEHRDPEMLPGRKLNRTVKNPTSGSEKQTIHLEPKQQPSASLKVLEHTAVTDRNNVSEKKKKRKRKLVDEIDAIFGL